MCSQVGSQNNRISRFSICVVFFLFVFFSFFFGGGGGGGGEGSLLSTFGTPLLYMKRTKGKKKQGKHKCTDGQLSVQDFHQLGCGLGWYSAELKMKYGSSRNLTRPTLGPITAYTHCGDQNQAVSLSYFTKPFGNPKLG